MNKFLIYCIVSYPINFLVLKFGPLIIGHLSGRHEGLPEKNELAFLLMFSPVSLIAEVFMFAIALTCFCFEQLAEMLL